MSLNPTREAYLAEAKRIQTVRVGINQELKDASRDAAATGRFKTRDWMRSKENKAATLLAREQELVDKARTLPRAIDLTIGRQYRFLCMAIKRDFGEETLTGLIADAKRLAEAAIYAESLEGEDEP